jgi:histidinol phosphatase-like enzyme
MKRKVMLEEDETRTAVVEKRRRERSAENLAEKLNDDYAFRRLERLKESECTDFRKVMRDARKPHKGLSKKYTENWRISFFVSKIIRNDKTLVCIDLGTKNKEKAIIQVQKEKKEKNNKNFVWCKAMTKKTEETYYFE